MTDTNNKIQSPLEMFKDGDNLCLLYVSVGPVQEFIAEARKARDLWAGSYMLSKATYEAMKAVISKHTVKSLILPMVEQSAFYKLDNGASVNSEELQYAGIPNHFIALIHKDNLLSVTSDMRTNLNAYWNSVANSVHSTLSSQAGGFSGWDDLWAFQIGDHFQIFWVALPVTLQDIVSRYEELFKTLQQAMEERKLTRTFSQNRGAKVLKCVQCGHREAMGPEDKEQFKAFRERMADKQQLSFKIKPGEKLCAVCLTKRLASEGNILKGLSKLSFDSTSDIASRPFRACLDSNKTDKVVTDLINSLSALSQATVKSEIKTVFDIPGDWFYEEGLNLKALKKQFPKADLFKMENAASGALECLKKVHEKYKRQPDKYYAILMIDGDKMGEYLSGKKMPAGTVFSLDWQKERSLILSALGTVDFPNVIKSWNGSLIYSGGDDLLAFGPLDNAIETAEGLRKAFAGRFASQIHCSAGMVIVHHQDSLRTALNECRNALQMAKECYGRDALAMTVMLSSGTTVRGGWKWDLGGGKTFSKFLTDLIEWFGKEKNGLSPAFVHDFTSELPAFYDNSGKLQKDMLCPELQRLLNRHLPDKESIAYQQWDVINKYIVDTIVTLSSLPHRDLKMVNVKPMENVEAVLRTASFIARQEA